MTSNELFYRQTWAEINLTVIGNNLQNAKKVIGKKEKLLAVVKANAYGHGAVEVARILPEYGVDYLGVATLDEAVQLRQAGVKTNILILGIIPVKHVSVAANYNIDVTVDQLSWLTDAQNYLKGQKTKLRVHVKVDTGMTRLGIQSFDELDALINFFNTNIYFNFAGIFTHYASADDELFSYTEMQQARFNLFVNRLNNISSDFLIHSCNSPAFFRRQYVGNTDNLFRLGIVMYGYRPSKEMKQFIPDWVKPALSLYSRVNRVKKIGKGTYVGYNNNYKALRDEWIAIVPIGYADGLRRDYKAHEVLINGVKCPIVGNICMDQCMVRLRGPVPVGTLVVLIGNSGSVSVTVEEIAQKNNTAPHDVLCSISYRVPRIYIK